MPARRSRSTEERPAMHSDTTMHVDDDSDISSVLPNDINIPDQSMFDGAGDVEPGGSEEHEESEHETDDLIGDDAADPLEASVVSTTTHELPTLAERLHDKTPKEPVEPVAAYLGILNDAERAAIAQRAYLRGPSPDDPDWLIAYAMHRAVDQLDAAMAAAIKRVATMLTEPREYVVHAEGGGGRIEDLADIRRHLAAIDERLAAFPYRSSATVERLTEPFANLAEASGALIVAIDKTRASAIAAINDASKTAREQMLRTAFEGHALPAKTAVNQFWITLALLIAILTAIVAVGLRSSTHGRWLGMHADSFVARAVPVLTAAPGDASHVRL